MSSKGELLIEKILNKERVFFKKEYSFSDLKSFRGQPLRFDFAIFVKGKLSALIEWQGEQHYCYNKYFYKEASQWRYALEMDQRKKRYALRKGIPLYCIPYTEYDNIKTTADLFQNKFLNK